MMAEDGNKSYYGNSIVSVFGLFLEKVLESNSLESRYLLFRCGFRTSSISISWELVRNAESQALLYTSCVRICVLMRFPGDVSIP